MLMFFLSKDGKFIEFQKWLISCLISQYDLVVCVKWGDIDE